MQVIIKVGDESLDIWDTCLGILEVQALDESHSYLDLAHRSVRIFHDSDQSNLGAVITGLQDVRNVKLCHPIVLCYFLNAWNGVHHLLISISDVKLCESHPLVPRLELI